MNTSILQETITELASMQNQPESIYYRGNTQLLKKRKIAIVGTRRPSQYTKEFTLKLSQQLSSSGFCIVSGGAMGVDALAHKGAGASNTIAVLANGLDIRYPAVNKSLIIDIENKGLLLSSYADKTPSLAWQFVARNEIVVALSEALIVCEADLNSGSMRSVTFALKMKKPIYVLPHRINESLGTNQLLQESNARQINSIDDFITELGGVTVKHVDDIFLDYCRNNSSYECVVKTHAEELFEYELEGKIEVVNGKIIVL